MQRQYEIMAILDPEADDAKVDGLIDRVTDVLSRHGGELSTVDRWGRRKLAFEIDRRTEGFYVILEITAESAAVDELDRILRLADDVIRFKIVKSAA